MTEIKNHFVKVFVTKSCSFRAKIKTESKNIEVTVGGSSWLRGKGKPYRKLVLKKCYFVVYKMLLNFWNITGRPHHFVIKNRFDNFEIYYNREDDNV